MKRVMAVRKFSVDFFNDMGLSDLSAGYVLKKGKELAVLIEEVGTKASKLRNCKRLQLGALALLKKDSTNDSALGWTSAVVQFEGYSVLVDRKTFKRYIKETRT